MRLVILGLSLALATGPAASQAPVALQPLAAGEVLLELGTIGVATVPADLATITVAISGTGETEAAARADLEAKYRRVVAAARQAGVPAAAITQSEPASIMDMRTFDVREEPPPPPDDEAVNAAAPMPPLSDDMAVNAATPMPPPLVRPHYTSRSVIVRVTDMARVDTLRTALAAAADSETGNASVVYSLTDSRAARQAARAQALAAVRADADAYATSLSMRVARIVRVSERTGVGLLPLLLGESSLVRQAFGPRPGESRGRDVSVFVVVGVDFALAPR